MTSYRVCRGNRPMGTLVRGKMSSKTFLLIQQKLLQQVKAVSLKNISSGINKNPSK